VNLVFGLAFRVVIFFFNTNQPTFAFFKAGTEAGNDHGFSADFVESEKCWHEVICDCTTTQNSHPGPFYPPRLILTLSMTITTIVVVTYFFSSILQIKDLVLVSFSLVVSFGLGLAVKCRFISGTASVDGNLTVSLILRFLFYRKSRFKKFEVFTVKITLSART